MFGILVAGVFRSQIELHSEILIPLNAYSSLSTADDKISIIEFTLKEGVDRTEALNNIAEKLPASVLIVKVQQPSAFMQRVNAQTAAFLDIWTLAVYIVVAAASYIITARLTAESAYELAMFKALGAGKSQIVTFIMSHTALTAFLGAILGTALGVAAAQTALTLLRWLTPTTEITPFLQAEQALKTIALTLASAVLGSAVPAVTAARLDYVEQPL
jgi:putative ABC transport system permease protein